MADPFLIDKNLFLSASFTPAVVSWDRLEGRPRKEDFARSLRAEVRDPLFMLCRQWQLGEFRGEDAGSAVSARLQVEAGRIDRYAPGADATRMLDDALPLEARVEREPIPMALSVRVQIGQRFARLAASHFTNVVKAAYLARYAIEPSSDPERAAQLASDTDGRTYLAAVAGRVADGAKLLTDIASGRHDAFVATLSVPQPARTALSTAGSALASWFAKLYSTPEAQERSAWQPERLEHRFRCSVPASQTGARATLIASGYSGGKLDWDAFDAEPEPASDTNTAATVLQPPISFLPAPIEFGGMPNVRLWQFEDQKTSFGGIRASTTDLAMLMLAELALIYGNDWLVVPYDLETGSYASVLGVLVTDVFGVRTLVRPAGSRAADAWQHWNIYDLHAASGASRRGSLLLLPTIGDHQQGDPIEAVTLTRDEMANMVFAIEETIPGEIGSGRSGAEAARALEQYLRALAPEVVEELVPNEARVRYVAGTTVPENWIPFLPVQVSSLSGDVRLQRGRMPRWLAGAPTPTVAPRGEILRHGLDLPTPQPYFIEEEEVPPAGIEVTRAFQRTRWYDGRIYVWLGRHKRTGRGEGESGLRFDAIDPA